MESSKIDAALRGCRDRGITNVLALRGDPPAGQDRWVAADGGFTSALDLVKHIRQVHGDYFSISVAGYPEGHPDKLQEIGADHELSRSEQGRASRRGSVCLDGDFKAEMQYLKQKVDAGADCVITQMFFDPEVYGSFVSACREAGITVPILPGIMCINSYGGFVRMTNVSTSCVRGVAS
jgi:methylenetetrahydrofolate reductase (NADPH)